MSTKQVRCIAMLTAPRYVATWPMRLMENVFRELGITFRVSGGVFYQQCMQDMFEDALKNEVDVIITVDMDSVFSASHVKRLLRRLVEDDSIDALASLQSRRGIARPLFSIETDANVGEAVEIQFDGKPLQVKTAHFGLTAIKANRLRDVCKPWFICQPGADGSYGDDRIEADIWFWKQWERAGKSVFIDSSVRIGHMEEMVSFYDEKCEHQVMYPKDFKAVYCAN